VAGFPAKPANPGDEMRLLFLFFLLAVSGCQQSDTAEIVTLQQDLREARRKLDSLSSSFFFYKLFNKTPEYYWFDLSSGGFARVPDFFYLSKVKTKFQENGVTISGILGNLEPMSKANIEITVAVRDTLYNEITGKGEVGHLPPGGKDEFSVFIPTQIKKIESVGFKFENYRM
jgi:hypothetical protein